MVIETILLPSLDHDRGALGQRDSLARPLNLRHEFCEGLSLIRLSELIMDLLYFTKPRAFGSTAPIQIPLVTRITHQPSAGPFIDFPKQLGFKFREDCRKCLDIDSHPAHEVTVLLQAWLFFGLLAEFLDTHINVQAFISSQNEDEGQSLDITILENLLVEWNDRIQSMPEPAMFRRKEQIWQCLESAVFQSEQFDHATLDISSSHFPAITLSVKLLILVLKSVAQTTFCETSRSSSVQSRHIRRLGLSRPRYGQRSRLRWKPQPFESENDTLSLPLPPGIEIERASPAARLLMNRMLEAGWCIHVIRKLCRSYDYATMNYFSLLRRGTDPSISHENCRVATQCIANNVSLDGNLSYITRHTDPKCQCSFLKVDAAELADIIRDGGIPLVLVTHGKNGFRLRLVRRQPRAVYVAFSHVWSDGLGNPVDNSLPECQINRLWNHVRRVRTIGDTIRGPTSWSVWSSPQELIWIDTLCIPVGPADDAAIHEVKSRAISHMASIYADASTVYVLDSELQRLNVYTGTHALPTDEVCATEVSSFLLCSAWMGRTWTLEEAMMAHNCRYILANCSYDLETQWRFQRGQFHWHTRLRLIVNSHLARFGNNRDPYDVMSLLPWLDSRSQPKQQKRVSPLFQARAEFDRLLCAHSARALNLDLHDIRDATSKSMNKSSSWRATQFARTWNSLLDRSTTKLEDHHGIVATLLDFNAYKVRSLEATKRMPTIIRSCDGLPLSLLFNNGPRPPNSGPPENGWIPSQIGGDRLTDTPVLAQTSSGFVLSNESNDTRKSLESLYVFILGPAVPFAQAFCIQDTRNGMEYFVQIRRPSEDRGSAVFDNLNDRLDSALGTNKGTCIIFDKQTGTTSPNGFLAAGAWLSISRTDADSIFVKYVCPLLVRTRASFERTHQEPVTPVLIRTERYQDWRQLVLEYSGCRGSSTLWSLD
jgi:hypothetical protein